MFLRKFKEEEEEASSHFDR